MCTALNNFEVNIYIVVVSRHEIVQNKRFD